MAINFTDIWGPHTQTIIDVCNGIGCGALAFGVLMLFCLPWAFADDEEEREGWRYGRKYKMNTGRKIGIWCGYLMFFCAAVYAVFMLVGFLTCVGIFIKAAYVHYWG
ncbi:hypothetical protein D3C87_545410 [compost metagenome]|jgi:hypothetical protein